MNLTFLTPCEVLGSLREKLSCKSLVEIHGKLSSAGMNAERELFFGSVFVSAVGKIQNHECLLKLADEPWDIEMIDKTKLDNGEKPNHWCIQNVMITNHYIKDQSAKGKNNIYTIFSSFLNSKKLSPSSGDYSGGMLVFHISLNLKGKFDLRELRKNIRAISQNKFHQIWTTSFTKSDYSEIQIAELLLSDDQSYLSSFP